MPRDLNINIANDNSSVNEFILPTESNPMLKSYRIHAYMINIMQEHSDFYYYLISNYLCLHNKRNGKDYLDFHLTNYFCNMKSLFYNNDWFDICQKDISSFNCSEENNIKDIIIDYLRKGYYVIHGVNESCLPHTIYYRGDVVNNIGMTCGYSYKLDSFCVLDYDKYGHFGCSWIPYTNYIQSIISTTIQNKFLNFIKTKQEIAFTFDQPTAIKLLKCHLNSQSAYPDYAAFSNNLIGYEAINRSLENMKNAGVDFIRLRAIKEHKNMVLRYLQHVCSEGIDDYIFYERYKIINRMMENIFMCILKDSFCDAPISQTINRIKLIQEINKQEFQLISDYLMKY